MSDESADNDQLISKSQLKREAHAITRLGEQLIELDEKKLRQFDLPENILDAVLAARKIKAHGARKRQLLYLGKLLRTIDTSDISARLTSLHSQSREDAAAFQRLEQWRDRLLTDDQALTELLNEYPVLDVQHIRQLIRTARKEQQESKPPAAARSLFRYLRDSILGR